MTERQKMERMRLARDWLALACMALVVALVMLPAVAMQCQINRSKGNADSWECYVVEVLKPEK